MPKVIKLFSRDREALRELKEWMEQHPVEAIGLKEMCKRTGLNRDKLKKGFKHLFNTSPYLYHLTVKMEEAGKLLAQTDKSIGDIAFTLGYQHSCSFCTAFRKYTGCSPLQFRSKAVIAK